MRSVSQYSVPLYGVNLHNHQLYGRKETPQRDTFPFPKSEFTCSRCQDPESRERGKVHSYTKQQYFQDIKPWSNASNIQQIQMSGDFTKTSI
ncbi:hypothetical protein FKM82_018069 [Ascaphus truei]